MFTANVVFPVVRCSCRKKNSTISVSFRL